MSASLNQLVAELRPWARMLVDVAARARLQPRITSTRRSHAEQARLYRRYLAGGNPYPVAPPGSSAHEFGFAFDLAISPMTSGNLRDLGQVWTSWGGVWGGAFEDPIHFELPGFPHTARVKPPQTFADKVIEENDSIPWYIQLVAPLGTTLGRAPHSRAGIAATKSILDRYLGNS